MRTRTIFVILLILAMLIAFGRRSLRSISQEIAEKAFGCEVNLNYVVPCVDYGQTFYDLGFLIWYSYLSLPAGGVLFASGRSPR